MYDFTLQELESSPVYQKLTPDEQKQYSQEFVSENGVDDVLSQLDNTVNSPEYKELTEQDQSTFYSNYLDYYGIDKAVVNQSKDGDFMGGVKRGLYQTGASFAGAAGLAADAIGYEKGRDVAFDAYKDLVSKAEEHRARVSRVEDIGSLDDAIDWLQGGVGSQVPVLISMALSGGVGAAVGKKLLTGAIKKAVSNKVASGTARDVARKQVTAQFHKASAMTGLGAGVSAMEAGGMWGEDAAKRGVEEANALSAFLLGSVSGASEALFSPVGKVVGRMLGVKKVGAELTQTFLKRLGIGLPLTAAKEGTQEVFQEWLGIINEKIQDPDVSLIDKKALSQYLNAGSLGAVMGAGAGSVNVVFPEKSLTVAETEQAVSDIPLDAEPDEIVSFIEEEIAPPSREEPSEIQPDILGEQPTIDTDQINIPLNNEARDKAEVAELIQHINTATPEDLAKVAGMIDPFIKSNPHLAGHKEEIDQALTARKESLDPDRLIPAEIKPGITQLEKELAESEQAGTITEGQGQQKQVTGGFPATTPDWFKHKTVKEYDKKYGTEYAKAVTKRDIGVVLKKIRSGEQLTPRQETTWDYLQKVAADLQQTDTGLVADQEFANLEKEGFELEAPKDVNVGNLKEGDQVVVMKGGVPDTLTHKGRDGQGDIVLEDGVTMHVDEFSVIPDVIAQKEAVSEEKAPEGKVQITDAPGEITDGRGIDTTGDKAIEVSAEKPTGQLVADEDKRVDVGAGVQVEKVDEIEQLRLDNQKTFKNLTDENIHMLIKKLKSTNARNRSDIKKAERLPARKRTDERILLRKSIKGNDKQIAVFEAELFGRKNKANQAVEQIAKQVMPDLRYEGKGVEGHSFTPLSGVSKGGTFTVADPTKENISKALKESQVAFEKGIADRKAFDEEQAKEPWEMTQKDNYKDVTRVNVTKEGEPRNNYLYTEDTAENIARILTGKSGHPKNLVYLQRGGLHHNSFDKSKLVIDLSKIDDSKIQRERDGVGEYIINASDLSSAIVGTYKNHFDLKTNGHKDIIRQALAEGKPVPKEVLKDYPDLEAKPTNEAKKPAPKAKAEVAAKDDIEVKEEKTKPGKKEPAVEVTDKSSIAYGQKVDTNPSKEQIAAENYKTPKKHIDGLKLSIENPIGTTRSGVDADGKEWSHKMKADYSRILGSVGYDKDHVDMFVKPDYKGGAKFVYVVNQHNKDGSFDEHKTILGVESEQEALDLYNSNYEKGWTGGKSVTRIGIGGFKKWVQGVGPSKGALIRKNTLTSKKEKDDGYTDKKGVEVQQDLEPVQSDTDKGVQQKAQVAKEKVQITPRKIDSEKEAPKQPPVKPVETTDEQVAGREGVKKSVSKLPLKKQAEGDFKVDENNRKFTNALQRVLSATGLDIDVSPMSVPKSLFRFNRKGRIDNSRPPASDFDMAKRIARIFGKSVVWAKIGDDFGFNGMVSRQGILRDKIFLDVRSNILQHVVLGHELSHHMEADVPQVYDELVKSLTPMLNNIELYREKSNIGEMPDKAVIKEMIGDLLGNSFTDPTFWGEVAQQNPGKFRSIANTVMKWLNNIFNKLNKNIFNTEGTVSDIEASRAALAKATSEYATLKRGATKEKPNKLFSEAFKYSFKEGINEFAQAAKMSVKDAGQKIANLKAFRAWLGDSKVVDEDGKPLVVYHGSPDVRDIVSFDKGLSGKSTMQPNTAGEVFYFTSDPEIANIFTTEGATGDWPKEKSGIMPVFLSIKDPYEIEASDWAEMNVPEDKFFDVLEEAEKELQEQMDEYLEIDPLTRDVENTDDVPSTKDAQKALTEYHNVVHGGIEGVIESDEWWKDFFDELKDLGYDGVHIVSDPGSSTHRVPEAEEDMYIAFEPTQIKSVYNQGQWNPADPDIMRSVRKTTTVDEDQFAEARKVSGNKKAQAIRSTRAFLAEMVEGTDKFMGAISTRLSNINPKLGAALQKLDFAIGVNNAKEVKAVKGLMDKAKKMTANDFKDWNYARLNSVKWKIDELVKKYGMDDEYKKYRKTLDTLRDDANDVGMDVKYIDEYAPRAIKDDKGFLRAIGKDENRPVISDALKKRADAMNIMVYDMTDEMKSDIISNALFGGHVGAGKPGNTKERIIKTIPPELMPFYMDADASLMNYLHSMRKTIEQRRFFGKVPNTVANAKKGIHLTQARIRKEQQKTEPNDEKIQSMNDNIAAYQVVLDKYKYNTRDYLDNIATYVGDLIDKQEISPGDERILTNILTARFHEAGARGIIQAYKNFSYIDTMGSVTSALTQIGDLAWAGYENGFFPTIKAVGKSIVKKSRITKEDVGIERSAQEFADTDTLSNAVASVFKWTTLEKIDSIGKEALLNSSLEAYEKKAKKNPVKLAKEIEHIFEGETQATISDLQNGIISENVKLLVYIKLLGFQPVALSEMPEQYLKAGNGRIFYMLKTFTLKQFDVYRREVYNGLKSGDKAKQLKAMKNMVMLSMFFVMANAGADELKDFVLGRKTDFSDRVTDNILRLFGVSKFVTWKARTEGVGSAMIRQMLPPFKFIDSITKDLWTAGDEKGLYSLSSIPHIGKLAYWHMGRGTNNRTTLWERRLSEKKKKLKKVKEKVEKNPDLRSKYRKELGQLYRVNKFQSVLNKQKRNINQLKAAEKKGRGVSKAIKRLEDRRVKMIETFYNKL